MKHEWPVLQNKWERLEIIQLREQWREEILMVQILYFIHIPTIKHFEFETIKKQQKEKRWEIKTNNHHTYTYNLIWKPHIHTGHPSGMISATPLIHDRRRRYSWCNRNKLTLRSHPTFSFVSMDSIFVCVREPIYVYIYMCDWLEQTPIINTMLHATKNVVQRVMKLGKPWHRCYVCHETNPVRGQLV